MKALTIRWTSLLLVLMLTMISLSACGSKPIDTTPAATEKPEEEASLPVVAEVDTTAAPSSNDPPPNAEAIDSLTQTQLNSISMLNHLVVLTQEINNSSTSRLYLEKAYSELYNNTYPNAVDSRTQTEINYLFNTIEGYRMIAQKRDRLTYIYEQKRAKALRDAMPNPLALLSATRSFSIAGLVSSVVYMAVDSYNNYEKANEQADLQYLTDGWALDDEQATRLHEIRSGTFNYMVDTVREYDFPGDLALNEATVADYVEWKGKENLARVIQFFEDNVKTYQAYGPYWLTLAECYYKTVDYGKCLNAVQKYESLGGRIFRRDHMLASILPYAIDSAEKMLGLEEYIETAARYADTINANIENDEWALRYFAAQTYIDIAEKSGDSEYLRKAFELVRSNINILLDLQLAENEKYLAKVEEAKTPDGATKAQKKDVEQYNKMLREQRKTELPPINEALLLNCELLFALADRMDISDGEKNTIDGILHEKNTRLFYVKPIDDLFWFTAPEESVDSGEMAEVELTTSELKIPASLVTDAAKITVTISGDDVDDIVLDDWTISSVERKDVDVTSFRAIYKSVLLKKTKIRAGMRAHIEIIPKENCSANTIVLDYTAVQRQKGLSRYIAFEKAE